MTPQQCEAIAFIGETLGPLYLLDPQKDRTQIVPGLSAFAALDVDGVAGEWPFLAEGDAAEALALMHQGAMTATADACEGLTWEYRRLFVGPGKKAAPPWGSVYTDRECVVFGESTLKLRAWMRTSGVASTDGSAEPEDHIGRMLLLMAWIARNKPELLEEYLQDHLLTWSDHYLEQLEAAAEHPFYQGLASLTRRSLQGVQEGLQLTVIRPRFYR